jgi:hypothetical protein
MNEIPPRYCWVHQVNYPAIEKCPICREDEVIRLLDELEKTSRDMIAYFRSNVKNFQYEKMADYVNQIERILDTQP